MPWVRHKPLPWWSYPACALVAGAGAWVIASRVTLRQDWHAVAAVAVVALAGAASPDLERRWRRVAGPALLALVALGGVYACVPETGHIPKVAVTLAGLVVAQALVGRFVPLPFAIVGAWLLCWAVLTGGTYRSGAIVGGLASFGLLVFEPLARRLPGPRRPWAPSVLPRVLVLVGLQGVYALVVSRTAGLQKGAEDALVMALPVVVLGIVATRLALGPRR